MSCSINMYMEVSFWVTTCLKCWVLDGKGFTKGMGYRNTRILWGLSWSAGNSKPGILLYQQVLISAPPYLGVCRNRASCGFSHNENITFPFPPTPYILMFKKGKNEKNVLTHPTMLLRLKIPKGLKLPDHIKTNGWFGGTLHCLGIDHCLE